MNRLTPAVKNLLIVNGLMLLLAYILRMQGIDLEQILGLHNFKSPYFRPFQFVTHIFMHANIMHLLFNMYALWMFGSILERVWGTKRFVFYYLFTGLGAAALHTVVNYFEISTLTNYANSFYANPTPDNFALFTTKYSQYFNQNAVAQLLAQWYNNPTNQEIIGFAITSIEKTVSMIINIPTVGASGAVFGLLLAFGMLFPNAELFLMFIPIPIKAKYFVIGYGIFELSYGVMNIPGDNIAHFAHLGGMIFGFILIKIWNKKRQNFY